eukprot:2362487-Amphidinium_carterae.1
MRFANARLRALKAAGGDEWKALQERGRIALEGRRAGVQQVKRKGGHLPGPTGPLKRSKALLLDGTADVTSNALQRSSLELDEQAVQEELTVLQKALADEEGSMEKIKSELASWRKDQITTCAVAGDVDRRPQPAGPFEQELDLTNATFVPPLKRYLQIALDVHNKTRIRGKLGDAWTLRHVP